MGYFHIDIAEVQTEEGKLYLFVAIDSTSKFAYAELYTEKSRTNSVIFLRCLIRVVPYKIHTILTDNGIQFTHRRQDNYAFTHLFVRVCLEHRLIQINHPWTNGQVERMNRTLKEATVKKYYYSTHQQLRKHLQAFLSAYNCAKRLKTLKGLTSYEFICQQWNKNKSLFNVNPFLFKAGLYT